MVSRHPMVVKTNQELEMENLLKQLVQLVSQMLTFFFRDLMLLRLLFCYFISGKATVSAAFDFASKAMSWMGSNSNNSSSKVDEEETATETETATEEK
jgi:hypothetical protein